MFAAVPKPIRPSRTQRSEGDGAGRGEGSSSRVVDDLEKGREADEEGGEPAQEEPAAAPVRLREIKESECFLTSVIDLRAAVVKARHERASFLSLLSSISRGLDKANSANRSDGDPHEPRFCRHCRP
jgi:hypothetical protein